MVYRFHAKVIELGVQWKLQIRDNKGYSERKDELREVLSVYALELATKAASLAKANADHVLFNMMNFSESDFTRATDSEIHSMGTLISNTVQAQLVALEVYHITEAILAEYYELLREYIDFKPQPRMQIEAKAYATRLIKEYFSQATALLKNMDREIKTLPAEERAFVDNYFLSRRIVNHGRRTLVLSGQVVDQDGNPLQVHISCPTLNINRKISKKGAFSMRNGDDGEHVLICSRPGYTTVKYSVNIFNGTRTNVLITMQLQTTAEPA